MPRRGDINTKWDWFSVSFGPTWAKEMLDIWLPRFDPASREYRWYPWDRAKLRIYRLDIPPVNPFAKARPWAWVLCYDIELADVWEPHIQGFTDNAVELTVEQLQDEAAKNPRKV